jgi:hypothetical protein
MAIRNLSDESLLRFYASIRQQLSADIRLGDKHRLLGEAAKQHGTHPVGTAVRPG